MGLIAMSTSDGEALLDAQSLRIAELETRLLECEDTLSAIRRGDFDAVVVETPEGERQIYTLENADRPYRALIEQIQEGALTLSAEGTVLYCNPRLTEMLDVGQERLIGQNLRPFVVEADRDKFDVLLGAAREGAVRGEIALRTTADRTVPVNVSLSQLQRDETTPLICGVLTDLTDQRQHLRQLSDVNARLHEEGLERGRVEEALRQAQKMEAVGQLTGGLAHDFNNLLAGISGNLELMKRRIDRGQVNEITRYIAAAQGAASRAAALTHRLLAFSRRQTLDPKPTNANRLIGGIEDLIRRTVGPAISFDIIASADPWTVLVDPPQLENALLNLCINARDAMPDGGRITIETSNRQYDAAEARDLDLAPGQYLSLCVSDTGTGMPPEVMAKAFDPFFTTKPIGEGTGLGLSMIYGFARQSGGQARIRSEVGRGTRISIFLPRQHGDETEASAKIAIETTPRAQQARQSLSSTMNQRCERSLPRSWRNWGIPRSRPSTAYPG